MKTTIKSETFRDALNTVNTLKISKQLLVLSSAQLSINQGNAKLTTTDLERSIEVDLQTESSDDFTLLLPRRQTQTFLYGKNGNISMELNDKGIATLDRDGIGSLQFKPYQPKDFPPMPTPPDDTQWSTIDAKWLCQMLDILLPACAKEISRPVLTGVCFSDGAMASADGFRLVSVKHNKLQLGLGDKQVIIPSETLALIKRLFGKEDSISIGFNIPDKAYFKSDKVLLTSQTIQGTYPAYEQLIPTGHQCRVSFSAPLMMQRLNMIAPETLNSGILRLQFQRTETHNEPECLLTSGVKDEDYAEYYSLNLPVKIETKEEAKIAFNYKYLCDAVRPFSMCNLELTSLSSPGKFTGDIEGLTIVVMPMFVQW